MRFLIGIFETSDPYGQDLPQKELTARQLLDKGAAELEVSFKDRPLILARLLRTTGGIYARLELFERAETLLRRALELREGGESDNRH